MQRFCSMNSMPTVDPVCVCVWNNISHHITDFSFNIKCLNSRKPSKTDLQSVVATVETLETSIFIYDPCVHLQVNHKSSISRSIYQMIKDSSPICDVVIVYSNATCKLLVVSFVKYSVSHSEEYQFNNMSHIPRQ